MNLKSALASAVIAAAAVVSGCASLEGPSNPDILAAMSASSQAGGE